MKRVKGYLCKFMMSVRFDGAQMLLVNFVGHKSKAGRSPGRSSGRIVDIQSGPASAQPIFKIFKASRAGDVIDQNDTVGAVNVLVQHLAVQRGAADVPDFEDNVPGSGQHCPLQVVVDSDGLAVLLRETL